MVKQRYRKKKIIANVRFKFFSNEVALGFILIFILTIISTLILSSILDPDSTVYSISFYVMRVLIVLIAIPLILIFSTKVFSGSQKGKKIQDYYISPSKGHLLLYKMTKKNYIFQLLYGLLLFLLVLVPINCLFFIFVPNMIEYTLSSSFKSTNYYLYFESSYLPFLFSKIVIQIFIYIADENISKGFLAKRGSDYYGKTSAVIITSLYLGFSEVMYNLELLSIYYPPWFPFIWFLKSFIIGIILSLFVLRKKWLFPVIFASILNNVIITHVLWIYLYNYEIFFLSIYIFLLLLIISCTIFIWQFSKINKTIQAGVSELKFYFRNDKAIKETNGDKYFRVFIDIIISGLFFLMSILITI